MKKQTAVIVAAMLLVSASYGCGAKPAYVFQERYFATNIMPGEAVVILLNESRIQHSSAESESKERSVELCMGTAMQSVNPQLKIVPANEFRRTLFPGKAFEDTHRSAEALLVFLQSKEAQSQVQDLGIRYLIVIDTDTHSYGEKGEFAAERGVWGVGKTWTRYSNFLTFIIDIRHPVKSGALSSSSSGKAGFVVPFLFILPLPPVPLIAATESEACSSLGKATIDFLEGREVPINDHGE